MNTLCATCHRLGIALMAAALFTSQLSAQTGDSNATPVIKIQADQVKHKVSPLLYGIMTEEINYSYEGGLYAELIRNRSFHDVQGNSSTPRFWSLLKDDATTASMMLDSSNGLNAAQPVSLQVVSGAANGNLVKVANTGYWGIPVKPNTTYRASFYAKAAPGFSGPLTVAIESNDGTTVVAKGDVKKITGEWQQYTVNLTAPRSAKPSEANRFVIIMSTPGTVWLNMVSLFPPTWKDRPNGLRPDIMQLLADMKPAMLRFPG